MYEKCDLLSVVALVTQVIAPNTAQRDRNKHLWRSWEHDAKIVLSWANPVKHPSAPVFWTSHPARNPQQRNLPDNLDERDPNAWFNDRKMFM